MKESASLRGGGGVEEGGREAGRGGRPLIVSVGRVNGTGVDAAGVDLKGWSTSSRCRLGLYGRKSHREPFALSTRSPQVPEVPGWVGSVGIYI